MRRLAIIFALVVSLPSAVVFLTGAGGGGGSYQVRAIFDNASFVVSGEDVKVAGVKVGSIGSLSVTPDDKAAVVLNITEPAFQDFRRDATCTIRPQSLIGEQFVDCSPTQVHAVGEQPPPALPVIADGDGTGQHLLPDTQTSASVGLDLIGDTARMPARERLSLILNELGVGLAGRGKDLNDVIRRAVPALQETDKLLNLLATQNHTLKKLAVDSDTILAPLARERAHVSGFIEHSATVAAATAERRAALEQTLQKLPAFLSQLQPTMVRLGSLADQMTPVVTDLGAAAPDIDNLLRQMGPFSKAATPALEDLGAVAKPGIPAIKGSIPIVKNLRALAAQLRPVGATLAELLTSFQKNDGLERLMDYVYYQALAVNGYDSVSHYLRAGLIVNTCSTYAITPAPGCSANFLHQTSSRTLKQQAAPGAGLDLVLRRTALVLAGMSPAQAIKVTGGAQPSKHRNPAARARRQAASQLPAATPGAPTATTPSSAPEPAATPNPAEALLDYLFGPGGAS